MDKEEIIKSLEQEFKDKNFNEDSLKLLCNAIYEFDSLFGKYIPREKVVELAKKNINSIEVVEEFEEEGVMVTYNQIQKRIDLMSLPNREEMKSTLFHEFVRAIMNGKDFIETFSVLGFSESGLDVSIGTGLVEGFTQYVTKMRDEKFMSKDLTVYPILTEQVENLSALIGKDKFLEMAFNKPKSLCFELFGKNYNSYFEFLSSFDIILQEEANILIKRNNPILIELFDLLREDGLKESEELTEAKATIIGSLEKLLINKPISSVEELNNIYRQLKEYCSQLGTKQDEKMLAILKPKIDELTQKGITREEILANMDEEFRVFYLSSCIINDFSSLSKEQKLEKLTDPAFYSSLDILYDDEYYDEFGKEMLAKVSNSILHSESLKEANDVLSILKAGLAKEIKSNEYNIDVLSLEKVKLFKNHQNKKSIATLLGLVPSKTLINLYDTTGEKKTCLGSFLFNENLGLVKFDKKISEEERKKLTEEYGSIIGTTMVETKNGEKLGILGDKYMIVDDTGETYTNDSEPRYHPSRLEMLQNRLKYHLDRIQQMESLGAPSILMLDDINQRDELEDEINSILKPEPAIKPEESSTIKNMQEKDERIMPMQALKNALQTTTTEETQKAQSVEAQLEEEKRKEGETIDD